MSMQSHFGSFQALIWLMIPPMTLQSLRQVEKYHTSSSRGSDSIGWWPTSTTHIESRCRTPSRT